MVPVVETLTSGITAVTKCYQNAISFSSLDRRQIAASFTGGEITSNAGFLLLREIIQNTGLAKEASACLNDNRRQASVQHQTETLLTQRLMAICAGYEDLNDHDRLKLDKALQVGCNQTDTLASSPTLCRLERQQDRSTAIRLHELLLDQFFESYSKPPKSLVLDFDATDIPVHGEQEQRFFHGYYNHYCFLPLYVFCGRHLLVGYLRHSRQDAAKHAWAILSLLVKEIRRRWPNVLITFRGDSGFCRHRMLDWCDRHNVRYIVGIARNSKLEEKIEGPMGLLESICKPTGLKDCLFREFQYQAGSWKRSRHVIAKVEYIGKRNPRFVVTNLKGDAERLYRRRYCARGEMENRIKDQQLDLFADRTSSHHWWPNQWRLLLSGLAWVVMEKLRESVKNTELEHARVMTLRERLIRIASVVISNTRRIHFLLPESCPDQTLFRTAAAKLKPG